MTAKYKLLDGTEVPPSVCHQLEDYGKAMELLDSLGIAALQDGVPLGLVRRITLLSRECDAVLIKNDDLRSSLRGLIDAVEKVQDWDTDTRVGIEIANANDALAN